ncbi:hypothetical protein OF83DRAFT_1173277 [Amylostereum chailletii]|nr:hypothetical protein OF83DRAFT_1173277 [Amylostereum chailletii]
MSDFTSFQSHFQGNLITPEHPDYERSLTRWAANSRRRAAIVAFVKNAGDVSKALSYAKAQGMGVAVRGGGHNPAGASSIEGGLVIDLSKHLAQTHVDHKAQLAYVGGGAIWATVNEETMKHGLATTGGTVSHPYSRLTLGGGFGYLAGSHGLVIDNLVQATVVIANGEVLTASETENADLFWGIRGGGSNFGVVTEFVLKVYPQYANVFSGFIIFPPTVLDQLIPIVISKHETGLHERESYLMAFSNLPNGTKCIMVLLFWNGSESEGREHFKSMLDLEPKIADMTREMPYETANTLLDDSNPIGRNYYLKSVDQLKPDIEVAKKVCDAVYELSEKHHLHITYIFEFWNLTKANTVPNSATAFQRTSRLSSLVNIQYPNDTPEELAVVRECAEHLTGLVTALEGDENINNGYANYNSDAPGFVDPNTDGLMSQLKTKALFGDHHAKLRTLKQKYDPDIVFNKWFAIKPTGLP